VLAHTESTGKKGYSGHMNQDLLDLHIAVATGTFNHVIVGVPGQRCDYFVHGPCLSEIGAALDEAKPGN
jgi:hypothetical protein